jgi:2-desacetyl-2-hydroxyethyl bacteriochlorophyllide A dehydrogenase
MRAAVFVQEGEVSLTTRDEPGLIEKDDVIIRVAGNGICGTDVHALAVPARIPYAPGTVIGHEFVGTIEAAGPESPFTAGQRVTVHPNIYCDHCASCRRGARNLCLNMRNLGQDMDGGLAELCRVPSNRVFVLPDELPFDRAVLAEPLACILNGTRKAAVHAGESVVVLGGGPIGLLYAMVLKANGAYPLIVSEPRAARRQLAADVGADVVVDPTSDSLGERVLEATHGEGADVVVDAAGGMIPEGLELIRRGGRVIVFGVSHRAREISSIPVIVKEASIHGVLDADENFPLAIKLLTENSAGFERLVTHRVTFDDFDAAVAAARDGQAVKAVVSLDQDEIAVAA